MLYQLSYARKQAPLRRNPGDGTRAVARGFRGSYEMTSKR